MKYACALLATALSASAGGCLELSEPPDVEDGDHALVGSHETDGARCTPYTEALVDHSIRLARTVMNSPAFAQCVQQKMQAKYVPCDDPFPTLSPSQQIAKAWEASLKANHMRYTCSYDPGPAQSASAHNQGWGTRGTHVVDLADDWHDWFSHWSWYSGIQPFDWRAAGLVHEFMHTHDYNHPNEGCPSGYDGGVSSVPYIYGTCVYEIIGESFSQCPDFRAGDVDELDLIDSWPAGSTCERVTDTQHRFALRTYNNRYVRAVDGGGSAVDGRGAGHGPWETLFFVDLNGGRLMSGDYVHIKTFEGSFLRRTGGGLNGDLTDPTIASNARFQIGVVGGGEVESGKQITLRADNRRYVVAEGGGGGGVNANRTAPNIWETFTVESPRRANVVRLRAGSTGRYVNVEADGGIGDNGRFSNESEDLAFWILDHNGGLLEANDTVSFETLRGSHFVSNCSTGYGQVRGTANYVSSCSRYRIVKLSGSGGPVVRNGDEIAIISSLNRYLRAIPDYPGSADAYKVMNDARWVGSWERFTVEHVQGERWQSR